MVGDNSGFCRTSDTTMSRSRQEIKFVDPRQFFSFPPPLSPITNEVCLFFFLFTISIFFVELRYEILDRKFFFFEFHFIIIIIILK